MESIHMHVIILNLALQLKRFYFVTPASSRLAPVLKTIFRQCAISYTCS